MGHTFRGVLTAWMALIVLRTVGTSGGSSKVAALFADVDRLVQHALSPDVPAIPDRRTGTAAGAGTHTTPSVALAPTSPAAAVAAAGNLPII